MASKTSRTLSVEKSATKNGSSHAAESVRLKELRTLILGPELEFLRDLEDRNKLLNEKISLLTAEINKLDEIITNPDNHAESIGDSLAEAFLYRRIDDEQGEHDVRLPEAVTPVVEESLNISVDEDPEKLAQAIYPIMLPAISKAIKEALQKMMQEINRTLDQQFSPKSLGWRVKALKSGRSYAEIVLSETLDYRVEQAFLIHKNSGLLLLHSSLSQGDDADADVISAMLTAIQDFVKDSFHSENSDALDNLNVGDLTVWVERAPLAFLAVVIRGEPPLTLRNDIREVLQKIHARHKSELADFQGDNSPFLLSEALLNKCLRVQFAGDAERERKLLEQKEKPSKKKLIFGALALALLGWMGFNFYNNYKWSNYVDHLNSQDGVVIVEESYKSIRGLVKEGMTPTEEVLNNNGFSSENVHYLWTSFESTGSFEMGTDPDSEESN